MNIDATMRRTRAYWYIDGLTEIAAGAVFLAIGVLFVVETALLASERASGNLSALGLPVIILAGSWVGGRAVMAAKRRLTFPRTGYVTYPPAPRRRRGLAAAVALLVALGLVVLAQAVGDGYALERATPLLDGLAVGVFLAFITGTTGVSRFAALAALAVVLGAAASAVTATEAAGSAVFFTSMGLALVLSGALVLRHYVGASAGGTQSP
jgi:hypothetical protein